MSDDIKKIDDEAMAKDLIAASPDVTHQEIQGQETLQAQKKNNSEPNAAVPETNIDEEKAARDAKIFKTGIKSGFEEVSGGTLNAAQEDILGELGREMFEMLQGASMPRGVRIGVLGLAASIAFLPLILKFMNAGKAA